MADEFSQSHPELAGESDYALLLLIRRRDEGAMARLFERRSRLVYSVAFRVLGDKSNAEDVLQEVFMQIWSKPLVVDRTSGSIGPLLAVMARNRSIDFLRRDKRTESPEDLHLASTFDLAHSSEHRVLIDRVRDVAAALPIEQQRVLDLAFFEGLTYVEIAAQTNTPLGTVKTRIRAALQSLGRSFRS